MEKRRIFLFPPVWSLFVRFCLHWHLLSWNRRERRLPQKKAKKEDSRYLQQLLLSKFFLSKEKTAQNMSQWKFRKKKRNIWGQKEIAYFTFAIVAFCIFILMQLYFNPLREYEMNLKAFSSLLLTQIFFFIKELKTSKNSQSKANPNPSSTFVSIFRKKSFISLSYFTKKCFINIKLI